MEFLTQAREAIEPPVVSVVQDNEDVNLMINNICVAYFNGADGSFHLCDLSLNEESEILNQAGIKTVKANNGDVFLKIKKRG